MEGENSLRIRQKGFVLKCILHLVTERFGGGELFPGSVFQDACSALV